MNNWNKNRRGRASSEPKEVEGRGGGWRDNGYGSIQNFRPDFKNNFRMTDLQRESNFGRRYQESSDNWSNFRDETFTQPPYRARYQQYLLARQRNTPFMDNVVEERDYPPKYINRSRGNRRTFPNRWGRRQNFKNRDQELRYSQRQSQPFFDYESEDYSNLSSPRKYDNGSYMRNTNPQYRRNLNTIWKFDDEEEDSLSTLRRENSSFAIMRPTKPKISLMSKTEVATSPGHPHSNIVRKDESKIEDIISDKKSKEENDKLELALLQRFIDDSEENEKPPSSPPTQSQLSNTVIFGKDSSNERNPKKPKLSSNQSSSNEKFWELPPTDLELRINNIPDKLKKIITSGKHLYEDVIEELQNFDGKKLIGEEVVCKIVTYFCLVCEKQVSRVDEHLKSRIHYKNYKNFLGEAEVIQKIMSS